MLENMLIEVECSPKLQGEVELSGAKNAVLVIMASLLLAKGKSKLNRVPASADVFQMIQLCEELGAEVVFDPVKCELTMDTNGVNNFSITSDIMGKMRASVLVMGPLLARFGKADVALPGGCLIGTRPIDYHLKNFEKMGVVFDDSKGVVKGFCKKLLPTKLILDYPSVGATENLMMAATLTEGVTRIVNAALEPEVLDLIEVLRKMGAKINILPPATIEITGVASLQPVEHSVLLDRLEAGSLLVAAAITGGEIFIPEAPADYMEIFLMKLEEMGHKIEIGKDGKGIKLTACKNPRGVSFKTAPYPGFPTDLQAPLMAALCLAKGSTSVVHETVFENRLLHVRELQKMGAQIKLEGDKAYITGVDQLYGANVIATDIRASAALVIAGLAAQGKTQMSGVHHWKRGYDGLEEKLQSLGAKVVLKEL
ncbi:MAG: UDP-N-acetylglucosamine enolpyruvyl transferase [candidate division TM6 bacterium GW2011_GWF2_32_72]|nr:MAG: UDP-N-acetylglucosamine enolpyruvyl transferase [candidate division TM6 bacterium GW2011_GWF2_32_72]